MNWQDKWYWNLTPWDRWWWRQSRERRAKLSVIVFGGFFIAGVLLHHFL